MATKFLSVDRTFSGDGDDDGGGDPGNENDDGDGDADDDGDSSGDDGEDVRRRLGNTTTTSDEDWEARRR